LSQNGTSAPKLDAEIGVNNALIGVRGVQKRHQPGLKKGPDDGFYQV
jgi:hypothetical protein